MTLLFYTAANGQYEVFTPLYIYFALKNNSDSYVEVGLEDPSTYKKRNSEQLSILNRLFGDRFKLTKVDFDGVLPGAVRFITEPTLKDNCDYVYIGDIDIILLDEDIKEQHMDNMQKYNSTFSNVIRPPSQTENSHHRLTGLHFAPTEVQYPLPDLSTIDYSISNDVRGADENVLYQIMDLNTKMISREMNFRPEHGIHMRTNSHPFGRRRRGRPNFSFEDVLNRDQINAWTGLEIEQYREQFLQEVSEDDFQKLYFTLDIKAKNFVTILENACRDRFNQFEVEAKKYIIARSKAEELLDKSIQSIEKSGVKHTLINKIAPYIIKKIRK